MYIKCPTSPAAADRLLRSLPSLQEVELMVSNHAGVALMHPYEEEPAQ
jgi:hypothetical protein